MLSWISRVIVICALVVCGTILFRKADFFKPRLRKLLYCFLALLVSVGVIFFPFEYWTEGFPSAEAALRFSSPAMMFSSFEVVEGENSVFALSENKEMGGANIAIVGKSDQGWSGVEVEDMSPCKTAYTALADIELYECRQTGEFYVLVAPVGGAERVLSDERETTFEPRYGLYVGYLGQVEGAYNLFLNGEEISVL